MGFTTAELQAYRDVPMPDFVGPDVRLLLVGINPSLWSAAVQAPFARPGNRFWPALALAGITDRVIDTSGGLSDADRDYLYDRGIGVSRFVARATARADELAAEELRDGASILRRNIAEWRPRVVAVVGISAYRTGFGLPKAAAGRQEEPVEGSEVWVFPNPSGLNAHHTTATLAAAYREAGRAAGIVPD